MLALIRRIDGLFLEYSDFRRPLDGASPAPRGCADWAPPGHSLGAPDGT